MIGLPSRSVRHRHCQSTAVFWFRSRTLCIDTLSGLAPQEPLDHNILFRGPADDGVAYREQIAESPQQYPKLRRSRSRTPVQCGKYEKK